ncbi:unnamed protein product [Rotaria socialis]|uniref:BZIP domain-containing protein n=2 Tax=Rotaria socialis TaxID=392032 RepID=A0A817VCV2_9BILA|nr:unnamed protein product [Rotaria socialis]
MSTPTMNHKSHMHQRQEQKQQQQQQQQQINEIQHTHSNSPNSPHATLARSDSTSTVILEEQETPICRRNGPPTLSPSMLRSLSIRLRSLLKTSGQFNKDLESSDMLNELFAGGNEISLRQLLSDFSATDTFDADELMKLDSTKLLESRTLSEFLRSESFDKLMSSATHNIDFLTNPPAATCSSLSFSELRPVSPELITNNAYPTEPDQLRLESNNGLLYTQMSSFDSLTSMPVTPKYDCNQGALNAFEHDHAFLSKRTPSIDSPKVTSSKRTPVRRSRRTSSRIQSRTVRSTSSETSSTQSKHSCNVNRATDIKTAEDLSYYLERRRKNNEASKMSRAARKQKFGDMDDKCEEYERVNSDLRMKIATLATVTATLKNGLVNNFQRKTGV